MDIFKLFFNHDQRLHSLDKRNASKTKDNDEAEATLADFMKPTPTYSKFYITGTRLEKEQFGINTLDNYENIINRLNEVFKNQIIHISTGVASSLADAIAQQSIGQAIAISQNEPKYDLEALETDKESNAGHKKEVLKDTLKTGALVLYKEQAHNGFDLSLFSHQNIYPDLFAALKPLVSADFRFFSINSKRMRSERHFYFETWTLDKPPHGAEEVFAETVL